MACITYRSPLYHRDTVQDHVRPLPSQATMISLERSFINDAIRTTVYNRPRRIPIIPRYDAMTDPGAQGYIQTPRVQRVLAVTIHGMDKPQKSNRNKLSSRGRCIPTPEPEVIEDKEEGYIVDAIKTEKLRTKYKDTLLKPYNAQTDPMCKDYFKRKDIQMLLVRTSPTSSMMSSSTSFPRFYSTQSSLSRTNSPDKSRPSRAGYNSPERSLTRSPGDRLVTSPFKPSRSNSPSKSRQATREVPRDKMPGTRSQSRSPRVESKNSNNQQSRSYSSGNNTNNNNTLESTSSSQAKSPVSSRSSRLPEEPLAEPQINKLSHRRRCIPTPPPEKIREREDHFVLDSVTTEKRRTKYRDIIPRYNAVDDVHAKAYFKRDDVQKLVNVTCTLKPWEKDIKEDNKKQ